MEHPLKRLRIGTGSASLGAWLRHIDVLTCIMLVVLAGSRQARAAEGQWQAGGRAGTAWLGRSRLGPVCRNISAPRAH